MKTLSHIPALVRSRCSSLTTRLTCTLTLLAVVSFFTAISHAAINPFFEGFNDNEAAVGKEDAPGRWGAGVQPKEWSLRLIDSPVTEGAKAARFELRNSDNSPKADLARPNIADGGTIPYNQDVWIGWTMMIPSGIDLVSSRANILVQLHPKNKAEGCGGQPSWTLDVSNNRYDFNLQWNDPCGGSGAGNASYNVGAIPRDTYVKFVVNFKVSNSGSDYFKAWVIDGVGDDSQPKVNYSGPLAYQDAGDYMRIGIYAPGCNQGCGAYNWSAMIVYFDEYRHGNSFNDVVPGGSSPTAPPPPTGLAATVASQQVSLSWNSSAGATGYNVKRSTTSGSGYSTIGANISATNYTDPGLTNGTTYYYVVSALNSVGESANSSEVAATPQEVSSVQLFPIADALVRGGNNASSNFGTTGTIAVNDTAADNDKRESYLKFDLSGVSGTVTNATLALYPYELTPGGTVRAFAVTSDSWTETGITYNNRPAMGSELASEVVNTAGQLALFDVTTQVASELAGDTIVSLGLKDTGSGSFIKFESREAANKPVLQIETSTGGGTPTLQEFEMEALTVTSSSGDLHEIVSDSAASDGQMTRYKSDAVGDQITYKFNVTAAGTYALTARVKRTSNSAQVQFETGGGTALGPVHDLYAPSATFATISLGNFTYSATGNKNIRVRVTGKNASSGNYYMLLDKLTLTP